MLTTDFYPGAPNWLDLGSPDTEASADFYGSVFGWTFASAGPDSGGYGFFQQSGKTVAALGPLTEAGARSAWTIYFHVPDADAATQQARENGGTVRVEPYDVFDAGRTAAFTDPGGAQFAIWQPGKTIGLDVVTEPGSLGWTELYVPDPSAVRDFYTTLFGWTIKEVPFGGGMTYVLASTAEGKEPDIAGIMPLQQGDTPHWLPYIEVSDTDATLVRVDASGGAVLMPAMDVEGVGRFAVCADPNGARFAVITSSET
ncbi:VOC family protein [Acrocarpospora macrocephala]|uniref:Hydroxylase n=1 Tax=Acrocarpospora macrocephala TaxID=150177 RepID=A0A5M3X050_9ACTN|nr:VOC family protein [Acrocarpospora macrocephala]GES14430.1 hydroxylase [Acrocarpospora macrocephala]